MRGLCSLFCKVSELCHQGKQGGAVELLVARCLPENQNPAQLTVAGFVRRLETELLLRGFASSPVVQVSGRVVLTLAPVHLNRAGMVGRIGDALFFAIEFPLLCIHDAMDCGLFGFTHGEGGLQSSF